MGTKIFTIDKFIGGITEDKYNSINGYYTDGYNLDFDRSSNLLQLAFKPTAMTEAAAANNITGLVKHIEIYSTKVSQYAYAGDDNGRIYMSNNITVAATWTLDNTAAGGAINAMKTYGVYMYYINGNSNLGRYDGGGDTYTDAYKTISAGGSGYQCMEIFAGNLNIGSGRFIDTLESDHTTYNTAALTLPLGTIITSLAVYGDYLAILSRQAAGTYRSGMRVYLWDGTSDTYNDMIEISGLYGGGKIVNFENNLYLLYGYGIYRYNGSIFEQVFDITSIESSGITFYNAIVYNNRLIMTSNSEYLYSYGRNSSNSPHSFTRYAKKSTVNGTGDNIYGINILNNMLIYGTQENAEYGIDIIDRSKCVTVGEYESLIFDMGEPGVVKLFKDIKLNMPPLPTTNETITITWKVDEESTYHTLTTVNSVNQHKWLPLQVRGKTLQLKLTYAAAGTNTNSPQLNSINISYANLGNRLSR